MKVTRETTLAELRLTVEALDGARGSSSEVAKPFLKDVNLKTKIGELPFFRGKGCDKCDGGGLKGRQGLYEVMFMTPNLRRLIMTNAGAADIRDAAVDEGMLTLRMDGWLKIMKGIIPLEQVLRETSA
jgi:type IV pilus assembly protein PilB